MEGVGTCACGEAFTFVPKGRRVYCDKCRVKRKRATDAAYRRANPERQLAWQKANPEKCRAACAAYYAANVEKERERTAAYRKANPEKVRAGVIAWQKANPRKVRAASAAYRKTNPDKASSRRLRRWNVKPELTATQWQAILTEYDRKCAYCGTDGPMTKDHKIPLSRGGSDNASNIVPACLPCNLSKNSKTPEEFAAWKGKCQPVGEQVTSSLGAA